MFSVSAMRRCLVCGIGAAVVTLAFILSSALGLPAGGADAATEGGRAPADVTAEMKPTKQELQSPGWWVEQALREAGRVENPKERERAFWRVGVAAFDVGQFDVSMQIMQGPELKDLRNEGTLASRLERAFFNAGDIARLEELAGIVKQDFAKRSALEELEKLKAAAAAGVKIGPEWRSTIEATEMPRDDGEDASRFVARWAAMGRFEEARELCDKITDPGDRTLTFAELARLWAATDLTNAQEAFAQALEAFEALPPDERDSDDTYYLSEVARAAAAVKEIDRCFELLRSIKDGEERHRRLNEVCGDRARVGDVAFTRRAIKLAQAGPQRDWVRMLHASACARAGQFGEATDVAQSIKEAESAFHAFKDLATALARAGKTSRYEDAVRRTREAMARTDEPTQWTWSYRHQLAIAEAHAGRTLDVWEDLCQHQDPRRRVTLMLGACDGLLAKLNGQDPGA